MTSPLAGACGSIPCALAWRISCGSPRWLWSQGASYRKGFCYLRMRPRWGTIPIIWPACSICRNLPPWPPSGRWRWSRGCGYWTYAPLPAGKAAASPPGWQVRAYWWPTRWCPAGPRPCGLPWSGWGWPMGWSPAPGRMFYARPCPGISIGCWWTRPAPGRACSARTRRR